MQWIQRGNNTTLSIRKSPQFVEFIFSRFIRLHYHLWSAMFMFFYWCWRQSWSQCWHYASVNTHRKVRCWPSLGLMRSADFFLHVFLCIQPPLFLTSFAVPAAQKSLQSKVWSSPDKRMFFLVISEFFNQLSRLSGTLKSKETYPWTLYHKVLIDVCCWDGCPSSRFFSLCTQSLSY